MGRLHIELANRQGRLACDLAELERVLQKALEGMCAGGELSVAIVDDEEMARLNRRFLGRDGPTDVLAFPYGEQEGRLEGEVVVNAEQALREAGGLGHGAQDELLLYVVHGVLHLLGYDDAEPAERTRMHRRALEALASAGRVLDSRTLLEE